MLIIFVIFPIFAALDFCNREDRTDIVVRSAGEKARNREEMKNEYRKKDEKK